MISAKQKTISGLTWSFIDNLVQKGITFVIGILLARLLLPSEFGLIGMVSIFITISSSIVSSGFLEALIQKKECTNIDYSTVFFFNLIAGILLYWILFFFAPLIGVFFNEPKLIPLIKVLALVVIIDSFSVIQRTILMKGINFKLQTKISVIASIGSGIIGVIMALNEFGVWSLVIKQVSNQALNSLLLWVWNRWRPLLVFSRESFLQLFSFSYQILIIRLLNLFYKNLFFVVIGKFFSAQELGFYTRATMFKNLPSENITVIINRVSYPVLARMQDDKIALKRNYKKIIKTSTFITFVLMIGMAAVAEPMVIVVIGEPWRPAIIYLQLLCFVGMMYPINHLNQNMLAVLGRTDLLLRLEIIKKLLAVPIILMGVFWGIKSMLVGMIVNVQVEYFLNSYWSGKFIGYSMNEQVKDVLPAFFLAIFMGGIVFFVSFVFTFGYFSLLIVQLLIGAVIVFSVSEIFRIEAYHFMKNLLISRRGL